MVGVPMKRLFSLLGRKSAEDLYFYKKDRELIAKMKESKEAKEKG